MDTKLPGHILICKTNIATGSDLLAVKPALDTHPHIEKWNIDQDDCDCVLRVVSHRLSYTDLSRLIASLNFSCEELAD